jgi:UDP-N-acetylmuramoyl-L-alanyl-D-glutamate--2,6-diaminopimelate ligase
MGAVAAEFADLSVLTSENPRSENAAAIVREIAVAMEAAGSVSGRNFEELPDRREAIARAFAVAEAGDYVLIAGKGAEQTMITGARVEPWDDRDVARELLAT